MQFYSPHFSDIVDLIQKYGDHDRYAAVRGLVETQRLCRQRRLVQMNPTELETLVQLRDRYPTDIEIQTLVYSTFTLVLRSVAFKEKETLRVDLAHEDLLQPLFQFIVAQPLTDDRSVLSVAEAREAELQNQLLFCLYDFIEAMCMQDYKTACRTYLHLFTIW